MTPPNGPPSPPRRRARDLIDSDNSLARDGLRALCRAVQDFRAGGMTNAEIKAVFLAEIRDPWDEATQ
jgi:hypothetical protein